MAESHVATTEWQSFEVRMRKRRAGRCVLRADVALDAGFIEDAHEAAAEARSLDPEAPGLADVEQRIAEAIAAVKAAAAGRRRRMLASAAAMAVVVLGGSLVFKRTSVEIEPAPANATPNIVAGNQAPAAPRASEPASAPFLTIATEQIVAREVTPRFQELESEDLRPPAPPIAAPELLDTPVHALAATAGTDFTRLPEPERPDTPVAALGSVADSPMPVLKAFNTARVDSLPEPPVAAVSTPPPAPPVSAPARTVDEDQGVRTVLARYESAYSALDAVAAGAVYPAIDRQALSRAFEGLAAQRVSLGECDVRVIGAAAHAECVGNASWTPKIGGGSHTQPRLWQFDLRRTDNGWHITRATARKQGSN
jgi:hypothetical protein